MSSQNSFILVVAGLLFEARIARRNGTARVCCGRGPEMAAALGAALGAAIGPRCSGILSFGIAGGLDPALRPGAQLVASCVVTTKGTTATDAIWSGSLLRSHPRAIHAPILSTPEAVADPADKNEHFRRTGAVAVDMESHIAAEVAVELGLPFAVLRVVADPATRRVPQAALSGLLPNGRTNVPAVLRALLRRPAEIVDLFHVARDAWTARLALLESPHQLGHEFDVASELLLPLSPATT